MCIAKPKDWQTITAPRLEIAAWISCTSLQLLCMVQRKCLLSTSVRPHWPARLGCGWDRERLWILEFELRNDAGNNLTPSFLFEAPDFRRLSPGFSEGKILPMQIGVVRVNTARWMGALTVVWVAVMFASVSCSPSKSTLKPATSLSLLVVLSNTTFKVGDAFEPRVYVVNDTTNDWLFSSLSYGGADGMVAYTFKDQNGDPQGMFANWSHGGISSFPFAITFKVGTTNELHPPKVFIHRPPVPGSDGSVSYAGDASYLKPGKYSFHARLQNWGSDEIEAIHTFYSTTNVFQGQMLRGGLESNEIVIEVR